MTESDVRIELERQMYRLNAQELEIKENQISQIKAVFDEREQRLEDTYNLGSNYKTKAGAYYRLEELRDLRKEIDTILRSEG